MCVRFVRHCAALKIRQRRFLLIIFSPKSAAHVLRETQTAKQERYLGMPKLTLTGHISLVQEQRFRLITDDGRGFLFTLARKAQLQLSDLQRLQKSHVRVRLEYTGEANTKSGLAEAVQPLTAR